MRCIFDTRIDASATSDKTNFVGVDNLLPEHCWKTDAAIHQHGATNGHLGLTYAFKYSTIFENMARQ